MTDKDLIGPEDYKDSFTKLKAKEMINKCRQFITQQAQVQNNPNNSHFRFFQNNLEFKKYYIKANSEFRRDIIKCSVKDKSINLMYRSIKKKKYDDCVVAICPELQSYQYLYQGTWIKYPYCLDILRKLIYTQLVMIYGQSHSIKFHQVQILIAIIIIIIEKFHPNEIPWNQITEEINNFIYILDPEVIKRDLNILIEQKEKKSRPLFTQGYNSKIKKINLEEVKSLLYLQSKTKKEIKEYLSEKYSVSQRLITQFMKLNGLTRPYNNQSK